MGNTMLDRHRVRPHVAEELPASSPKYDSSTNVAPSIPPPRGQRREISWASTGLSCQEWYIWVIWCCITTRVGHASTEIPPPPPQRFISYGLLGLGVLFSARPHGLHARPGHQGGGGGLAAQGEMCMKGATNLVGEAAEASLAGPTMLER